MESVRRTRCALKAPSPRRWHRLPQPQRPICGRPWGCSFAYVPASIIRRADLLHSVPSISVIVRENTEDLYAGNRVRGGPAGHRRVDRLSQQDLAAAADQSGPAETGVSIKPISVSGSERIIRWAFDYARQNGRKKVTVSTRRTS